MDYTAFRENLNTLIRMRGISGFGLATELGITPSTVTRHLAGTRNPELEYIVQYARYFSVSVDWLLGLSPDQHGAISEESNEMLKLYAAATSDDRIVVQAVLAKYRR